MPSDASVPTSQRRFRPEIEGLRAVAALLVAAYHVWFGRVSGGVDVFFVVAGFMVTNTLLGHLERTGRIDVGRYLGRLLARLLPNALVVLLTVAVTSWFLVPTTRRDEVFSEIAASALYYENWQLAARSVDYLARDFTNSPVQHFWAMSIQGQFYLIWLVLFVVAVSMGGARSARRRIGTTVAILVLLSFAFSVWFTDINQPAAYFNTAARVWEFGIGALLALTASRWPAPSRKSSFLLGWAGLLAIVSCGAILSVGTSFPGWIALWPVAGASLILLAGHCESAWSASTLLSSKLLVSLGAVSYALYLWHWPVLVFVLILTEQDRASIPQGLMIVGVSILLSYASTRFVERPLRSRSVDFRGSWTVPLVSVVVVAPFAFGAYAISSNFAPAEVARSAGGDSESSFVQTDEYPGADREAGQASLTSDNTADPAPGLAEASEDIPAVYADGCHQTPTDPEVVSCTYGQLDADRTMVLVGGSHSAHWQPALRLVAEQQGWRLLSATKSGCRQGTQFTEVSTGTESVGLEGANVDPAQAASCRQWNEALMRWIPEQEPDLVVMTSTTGSGSKENVPATYQEVWRQLSDRDIAVLAIRDTPRPQQDMVDCLAQNGTQSTDCDLNRAERLKSTDPTRRLASVPPGVTFIDLTDQMCNAQRCPAVVGNVIVFSDNSHLTRTFSRTLAPALVAAAPVLR
ncbi:MAG: acyltransferase family protein [Ornithinimicrobium sp.]